MPQRFLPHLERILIPLGKDGSSEALLNFLICMLQNLPQGLVKTVYLLHVVSADVIKKASRRDFRLEILLEDVKFLKQLYQEYLEKEAGPFLDEAEEKLRQELPGISIEKVVLRGDPPSVVARFALEKDCGAEIIARRARSHLSELVLGSCTQALIHRPGEHSTYVVGKLFTEEAHCVPPKILVCLDGSAYAQKALEEAAGVALLWKAREMVLFHVVDILPETGEFNPEEKDQILLDAENFLKEVGLTISIEKKLAVGSPADEIIKEAELGRYDLVFIGRRGRGHIKELLLGSVSEKVLHRLVSPTLVVVSRS